MVVVVFLEPELLLDLEEPLDFVELEVVRQGSAHAAQILVDAGTVKLHGLAVEEKAFVGIKFHAAEAEGFLCHIPGDNAKTVEGGMLQIPKLWVIHLQLGFHGQAAAGGNSRVSLLPGNDVTALV